MKYLGLEVIIKDDKKEKHQSFSASIETAINNEHGNLNFDATAYGSTGIEALMALRNLKSSFLQCGDKE